MKLPSRRLAPLMGALMFLSNVGVAKPAAHKRTVASSAVPTKRISPTNASTLALFQQVASALSPTTNLVLLAVPAPTKPTILADSPTPDCTLVACVKIPDLTPPNGCSVPPSSFTEVK